MWVLSVVPPEIGLLQPQRRIQRVQNRRLPGAIRPDQHRQRLEVNRNIPQAAEVLDTDALQVHGDPRGEDSAGGLAPRTSLQPGTLGGEAPAGRSPGLGAPGARRPEAEHAGPHPDANGRGQPLPQPASAYPRPHRPPVPDPPAAAVTRRRRAADSRSTSSAASSRGRHSRSRRDRSCTRRRRICLRSYRSSSSH